MLAPKSLLEFDLEIMIFILKLKKSANRMLEVELNLTVSGNVLGRLKDLFWLSREGLS